MLPARALRASPPAGSMLLVKIAPSFSEAKVTGMCARKRSLDAQEIGGTKTPGPRRMGPELEKAHFANAMPAAANGNSTAL